MMQKSDAHHGPDMRGHTRVSTTARAPGVQRGQLPVAGCEKIIRATMTGTRAERPKLRKLPE